MHKCTFTATNSSTTLWISYLDNKRHCYEWRCSLSDWRVTSGHECLCACLRGRLSVLLPTVSWHACTMYEWRRMFHSTIHGCMHASVCMFGECICAFCLTKSGGFHIQSAKRWHVHMNRGTIHMKLMCMWERMCVCSVWLGRGGGEADSWNSKNNETVKRPVPQLDR